MPERTFQDNLRQLSGDLGALFNAIPPAKRRALFSEMQRVEFVATNGLLLCRALGDWMRRSGNIEPKALASIRDLCGEHAEEPADSKAPSAS